MEYYAHSGQDTKQFSDYQSLADHLCAVAAGAESRACAAVPGRPNLVGAARLAGLLHDLGKYRAEFQDYIRALNYHKGDPRTWHKQAGAAAASESGQTAVALTILGHHGGIPDGSAIRADLKDGAAVAAAVRSVAGTDCPELALALSDSLPRPDLGKGFQADLLTRLLFSCLVDADWTDTGEHQRKVKGLPDDPNPPALDPARRLEQVQTLLTSLAGRPLEPHVKQARADVLAACLSQAEQPPGLFSLTVPTGGGKTLAALAFALKHAAQHGLRRIIYVAPYMTILEQNADVIRAALGVADADPSVFEHYSLAEPPGDADGNETATLSAARRAENWDAPVVVTTNVQFFESLFSNKPGRCRKLHNIARSVIVLDECQTLPPGLAAPTCGMLKQLATDLGCSVVLCTATQPAFDHSLLKEDERLTATEIIPHALRKGDADDLFVRLRRVHVTWPKPSDPALSWSDVARQMRKHSSALCVVNTKKAARGVYEELVKAGVAGVFHLSTGMCPQHRREKLAQIRSLLPLGAPCFVVSTQLIEAGVDVDFPFLMREMAPLESIIQAAGRCNREGKLSGVGGQVVVFRSIEGGIPGGWYSAGRDVLEAILRAKGDGPQMDDPAAIREYFNRHYYAGKLDQDGIQDMRRKFQFETLTKTYRLINDAGQPVVVASWESRRAEIESLLAELAARPRRSLYRRLAPFQVNLLPSQVGKTAHLFHEGPGGVLIWDGKYDEAAGIMHERLDQVLIG